MKKIAILFINTILMVSVSFAQINIENGVADIAESSKASVVNISTVKMMQQMPEQYMDPFRFFFEDDVWRRYQTPKRSRKQSSLGSGVIIDKKGYIVTNYHVIKGADEIQVKLSDKREFEGEVVGFDEKTDVAIIKIKANNLMPINLGNSDALRVGEWAIAIGNPFGLSQTVTLGIISAKGRSNVGIVDYEDFIQTDAAINPGNSGGALLNIKGELIGINTAIFSRSGGYQGIGFAIPVNMVKYIFDNLLDDGKITRGWLGVHIQEITSELAKQLKLSDSNGVLVSEVVKKSPADKGGLKRGDVIVKFDGVGVDSPSKLRNKVASTKIGKKINVEVIRKGRFKTLKIKIDKLKEEAVAQNLFNKVGAKVKLNDKDQIVIDDVKFGSNADDSGLRKGDIVLELNQEKIESLEDFNNVIDKTKKGDGLLFLIQRGSSVYYTVVKVK